MVKIIGLIAAAAAGYWIVKGRKTPGNRTKTFSLAAQRGQTSESGRQSSEKGQQFSENDLRTGRKEPSIADAPGTQATG